jgi:hypothetical protein
MYTGMETMIGITAITAIGGGAGGITTGTEYKGSLAEKTEQRR